MGQIQPGNMPNLHTLVFLHIFWRAYIEPSNRFIFEVLQSAKMHRQLGSPGSGSAPKAFRSEGCLLSSMSQALEQLQHPRQRQARGRRRTRQSLRDVASWHGSGYQ
jgi:hypothetical protein